MTELKNQEEAAKGIEAPADPEPEAAPEVSSAE